VTVAERSNHATLNPAAINISPGTLFHFNRCKPESRECVRTDLLQSNPSKAACCAGLSSTASSSSPPPGGGEGYSAIILRPQEGVIGPRTAEAQTNGVVNREVTQIREWTPGDKSGPHQFA